MTLDQAKLEKLRAAAAATRIGGKGTPRRKVVPKSKASTAQDDKKLQSALKKLNVQPVTSVEEVNMFKEDGNVLHFTMPKVHAAMSANTLAIYGTGVTKDLTELVPGILSQLGPDSLSSLKKLAESYQNIQSQKTRSAGGAAGADDDDDDVPDLVDNFDVEEKGELEELN